MANENKIQQNKNIIDKFLVNREILPEYRVETAYGIPYGYIYCIENLKNNKKYVGSMVTVYDKNVEKTRMGQLQRRATNIIYEYNYALENKDDKNKQYIRPIIQAMAEDGIENFIMYVLGETSKKNHKSAEIHFMEKLDSVDNGYNTRMPKDLETKERAVRKAMTAGDKKIRSTNIICVNKNDKQIVFSDSMKLFGDFMNCSKDMIKNANRKGRAYRGWNIFYVNNEKRDYILKNNVLGEGLPPAERHSKESKEKYQILFGKINEYLNSSTPEGSQFGDYTVLEPLEYKE